ncbi:CD276 antigen homolog [Sinocyclocheilus rhinocerous]|uniref:CD276 antigen homolog n=1 Tax=Sinocyclocheilus rhinocerous TaxID=307959 RepID=A0A673JTU4_9TELE|nr:PREDICTED: CD276 antigen homolog [Sinocyclocheilus rhinocerous]
MMTIRCCIVLLHLVMLNEVSLQNPVVGFIGDSAVLPCFSKEGQLKRQEITVHWRYNDSLNVYDIINGQGSVEEQHSAYKGRAETFSDDFEKGNFSLKLSNLQHNDTGQYVCYESTVQSVALLVKEKEISIQVQEKNKQTEEKGNQGAQSRPEKIVTLGAVLSVFILLCI